MADIDYNQHMIYVWRVWKNNRFAGYVQSPSEQNAYLLAKDKFGSFVWIERISCKTWASPT
jgi:hypothetical protein